MPRNERDAAASVLHARIRPLVDHHRDQQARLVQAVRHHPKDEARLMKAYVPELDRYLGTLFDTLALFPRFYGQKPN